MDDDIYFELKELNTKTGKLNDSVKRLTEMNFLMLSAIINEMNGKYENYAEETTVTFVEQAISLYKEIKGIDE